MADLDHTPKPQSVGIADPWETGDELADRDLDLVVGGGINSAGGNNDGEDRA